MSVLVDHLVQITNIFSFKLWEKYNFLSYQVKGRVDVVLVRLRRWRRVRGGQGCGVLFFAAMEKDFQKNIFGFFVGRNKALSRTKTDLKKNP